LSDDFLADVMQTAHKHVLQESTKAEAIISAKFKEVFGYKDGKK